jgi:hypothetical protein
LGHSCDAKCHPPAIRAESSAFTPNCCVGMIYTDLGQFREAEEVLLECLAMRKRLRRYSSNYYRRQTCLPSIRPLVDSMRPSAISLHAWICTGHP